MSQIGSLDAPASQASQALPAASNADPATAPAELQRLGQPPASLAQAAAANTINAHLATSQWGVDPAAVSGVYGGAGRNGGLFSGSNLLPLLESLSPTTAEQALTLLGIPTPRAGSASSFAAAARAAALAAQARAAFAQASSDSTPVVADPLWGKTA
jgi:hypothetical protein